MTNKVATNLLAGLVIATLSTNAVAAGTNIVAQKTGLTSPVIDTNNPVEAAYYKILLDDDAAEQEVNKWIDQAEAFKGTGAAESKAALHERIRHRLDLVKNEYEDFIAQHPNHVNIRLAYGSFLNDTHDQDAAVGQWDKARQLAPNNPAPWNNLANIYGHRGPINLAFEYYGKAIELDSHEPVYYQNLAATIYLFRTDAAKYYHLTEAQVFDKSLDLYRKAIKLDPNNFILYSDYAMSFYGIKPPRWPEGLQAWTDSLKIAHDDQERQGAYIHMARINIQLHRYDDARRNLDMVNLPTYDELKKRLTRNLNESIVASATNNPALRLTPAPAPAK